MENFKKQYRDLQTKVFNELRNKIDNSTYKSKFTGDKAIEVDFNDYIELTVINHRIKIQRLVNFNKKTIKFETFSKKIVFILK
jgi:hypothetical protein